MRAALSLLLLAFCCPVVIYAQSIGRVSGIVSDAQTNQLLDGATISVLDHANGLFLKHAVSNKRGEFTLGGLPLNDSLDLAISYTGYRDTGMTMRLTASSRTIVIGNFKLQQGSVDLDSVTVTFRRPPFVIRKDTMEFAAQAFKSLPSDMLQDLLRKIPGMVVDGDGNVLVNGKKVSKIKVDGREFFDGNLKTALENLPGSAIDKVQVSDIRERGTEHNSIIQPIAEAVTLNLTLKKENKKGLFGHAGIGAGTLDRYNAGAFINVLDGEKREAVFANSGNIPASGGAQFGGSGIDQQGFSGGSGILKNSTGAGININNNIGRKGTVDLGYSTSNTNQSGLTLLNQTNILPDSTFQYNSDMRSNTMNHSHTLRAAYINNIDTLQQLFIAPEITYADNRAGNGSLAQSVSMSGLLINRQDNQSENRDRTLSVDNRVSYSLSSRNHKTNIHANWTMGVRNNSGTLNNRSNNEYYNSTLLPSQRLDQQSGTSGNGVSNQASINFSRVVSKAFTAIVNYSFSQSLDNYNKDTYNYDSLTGKHDQLDSLYSVHSSNTSVTHVPTASIGFHHGKLSIEAGAGMSFIQQQNKIIWKDSVIIINQHNFSPRLTTAYQFAKYVQWITNYTVNANAPGPDQLAPVQDNINPLYIKLGNPNLRSEIIHNIGTQLQAFTRDYIWHGILGFSGTASNNQIISDTYYDTLGRQVSTFQNTSGNFQVTTNVNGGTRFSISQLTINMDAGLAITDQRSNGFINHDATTTRTKILAPNINLGVQYKEYLAIQTNAAINFNSTNYSLPGTRDVDYRTTTVMMFLRIMPMKRLMFHSSAWYSYHSQLPDGFQRSRTLVNASLDYHLLKAEKLSVGITVNDLLNNNTTITRTVSSASIQNTQVNALKRYAMINASYRFNSFHTAGG